MQGLSKIHLRELQKVPQDLWLAELREVFYIGSATFVPHHLPRSAVAIVVMAQVETRASGRGFFENQSDANLIAFTLDRNCCCRGRRNLGDRLLVPHQPPPIRTSHNKSISCCELSSV